MSSGVHHRSGDVPTTRFKIDNNPPIGCRLCASVIVVSPCSDVGANEKIIPVHADSHAMIERWFGENDFSAGDASVGIDAECLYADFGFYY